jgi:hypothetical protein
LINFSIRAETVLGSVDTSLDNGRFYLVNRLWPEGQAPGNLLGRARCDQLVIFTHGHHHEKFIRISCVDEWIGYCLPEPRCEQFQLVAA